MIGAGAPYTQIGRKTQLSADAIARHAKHLFKKPAAPITSREERIAVWLDRCESLFFSAGNCNDLRGQIAAVREALRVLELQSRRAGELSPDSQTNLQVVNIQAAQPRLSDEQMTKMCTRWLMEQGWTLLPPPALPSPQNASGMASEVPCGR